MENTLILLIEDNEKHQEDAILALKAMGYADGFMRVSGSGKMYDNYSNLETMFKVLEMRRADTSLEVRVLTDMYFPARYYGNSRPAVPLEQLAPLGMVVMGYCQAHGIPCVIVTAGYHHGARYNEVCMAGRTLSWPEMVDGGSSYLESEAPKKNWEEGLKRLLAIKTSA